MTIMPEPVCIDAGTIGVEIPAAGEGERDEHKQTTAEGFSATKN